MSHISLTIIACEEHVFLCNTSGFLGGTTLLETAVVKQIINAMENYRFQVLLVTTLQEGASVSLLNLAILQEEAA